MSEIFAAAAIFAQLVIFALAIPPITPDDVTTDFRTVIRLSPAGRVATPTSFSHLIVKMPKSELEFHFKKIETSIVKHLNLGKLHWSVVIHQHRHRYYHLKERKNAIYAGIRGFQTSANRVERFLGAALGLGGLGLDIYNTYQITQIRKQQKRIEYKFGMMTLKEQYLEQGFANLSARSQEWRLQEVLVEILSIYEKDIQDFELGIDMIRNHQLPTPILDMTSLERSIRKIYNGSDNALLPSLALSLPITPIFNKTDIELIITIPKASAVYNLHRVTEAKVIKTASGSTEAFVIQTPDFIGTSPEKS